MNNIIIRAAITEKSMKKAQDGKFTFIVQPYATKKTIKSTIEKGFNVHVVGIATMIMKGKSVKTGAKRTVKQLKSMKKAVVTLRKGEKIALFEAAA